MRQRFAAAVLLALPLVAACDEHPTPPLDGAHGRAVYTGPSTVTLSNDDVSVVLRLDRFGLRVSDATGRVVLDTFDGESAVVGDDTKAYGAFGATYHETEFAISLVEGWDHVRGTDDTWHHGAKVAAVQAAATSATVDIFDAADEATTLRVEIALDGPEVRIDGRVLDEPKDAEAKGEDAPRRLNQMGVSFVLPPDEHFFGLGERLVTVDHRGRHFQCWVEEGGIGQGEGAAPGPGNPGPNGPGMTHLPVPFVLSSKGHGLWLDTSYRTGFSLGADDSGLYRIYAEEPALHLRVLVHADPKETLAHYTRLTGRAHLPAPWVFGPRRRVDRGTLINGVPEAQALRNAGVPTTMVDDTTHFLPIATEVGQEKAIAEYNELVHALGYKSIAYYNPYVSVENPATKDLVEYGRKNGYFVKLDDGTEFDTFVISSGPQSVATIDLTNPGAVAWYRTLLQRALTLGYDGWMLDFAEYIPQRAVMFDGRTGWEAHNAFPEIYARAVFEYLREVRGDDFMFFARAGYTGSQAVTPVIWSGDPAASFDDEKGLPAQVRAGVNAGLSGFPYWGSDVSGYSCLNDPPPDKEVYLRWAAFGALSPDMHDENACAGKPDGSPPKWTLWSDAETTLVYGKYARLHTRLFPYIYAAAKEAAATGTPILRHPLLEHPNEPDALSVELEYYFGPSLYVAPVVRRKAVTRELWLPPGRWFDWWTLEPLAGGAVVTRDAPLDVLPLFLRSGGIVAMLDSSIQTLAPSSSPDVVDLSDVAGVLDVRAAIDPSTRTGRAELADGTVFDITLGTGAVALPAGVTEAADEATLATCTLCGRLDATAGGGVRVRVTGSVGNEGTVQAGALALHHHAIGPLRARWDVVVGAPTP